MNKKELIETRNALADMFEEIGWTMASDEYQFITAQFKRLNLDENEPASEEQIKYIMDKLNLLDSDINESMKKIPTTTMH